jgi:hypothetical protein
MEKEEQSSVTKRIVNIMETYFLKSDNNARIQEKELDQGTSRYGILICS